jgi:hypothetical protein
VQNKNYHPSQVLERKKKIRIKESSSIPGVRKKKKIRIKESSSIPGVRKKKKLELKNHHPSRVFESNRNQRLNHPSQAFEQIGIKDSIIHARRLKKNKISESKNYHPS